MRESSIVKYLVEVTGADIKARDYNGCTVTDVALKERKSSIAAYLCGLSEAKVELRKFEIDSRNEDSQTALMRSAGLGTMSIVKYLIREGAEVNLRDKDGNTALSFAVNSQEFEVAHYLYGQPGIDDNMIHAARPVAGGATEQLHSQSRKWTTIAPPKLKFKVQPEIRS